MLRMKFSKKLSWQSSSSSSSLTFPTRRCWTECVPMANLFCYLPKSRAGQLPLFDGSPSPISIDVSMGFQSYTFTYEMFHGIYMCIYTYCIYAYIYIMYIMCYHIITVIYVIILYMMYNNVLSVLQYIPSLSRVLHIPFGWLNQSFQWFRG